MSQIKTVALAGASGSLGAPILKALLEHNFTVTVLTRSGSSQTYPSTVKVAEVDYTNPSTLKSALQGQDAVISAVGYAAFRGQEALIDAAIATGVKLIIPSEFGADPDHAAVRALPVFADKQRIAEYVKAKTAGTETSYTLICNNEFLDWDLEHAFGVDIKNKKITIFDGGDVVHTSTPMGVVAHGVVGVLKHPDETRDRVVRVHGRALTQNHLFGILKRVVGEEGWEVEQAETVEREKEAWRILNEEPANWMGWAIAFLQASVWGKRFGGDFSARNDNGLLGVRELTDGDVEEIVRRYA